MDLSLLLASSPIIVGILLLLTGKYVRLGSLIAGLGFIPLGIYQLVVHDTWVFLVLGIAIGAIATYRFFRPYTNK